MGTAGPHDNPRAEVNARPPRPGRSRTWGWRRKLPAAAGPRLHALVAALALASARAARAQDALAEEEEAPAWSVDVEALYVLARAEEDYVTGKVFVDQGALHLEARYNYEDLRTLSAFVGWNLGVGERLRLELTPMVGGVVGRTVGVAPGLELTLSYGRLVLWSENEYVLVPSDADASFFYTWTELSLWPVEWARAGVNLQWARERRAGPVAERGFHAGLAYRSVSVAAYVFNPGADDASTVFMLSVDL